MRCAGLFRMVRFAWPALDSLPGRIRLRPNERTEKPGGRKRRAGALCCSRSHAGEGRGKGNGAHIEEVEGAGTGDGLRAALHPKFGADVIDVLLDHADAEDGSGAVSALAAPSASSRSTATPVHGGPLRVESELGQGTNVTIHARYFQQRASVMREIPPCSVKPSDRMYDR